MAFAFVKLLVYQKAVDFSDRRQNRADRFEPAAYLLTSPL